MEKLHISNEMQQLDTKNRDFYDSLDDQERKKFSTFLMIRWSSTVSGSKDLQEYYVQSSNHYLNKHFFMLSRHPKLQWLLATAVSPGLGPQRHNWIGRKRSDSTKQVRKFLQQKYPTMKLDDIKVLENFVTVDDVKQYENDSGK